MDGIIIINKEKNWTSNDIVQKVKSIVHKKVGHTGTLDPLATGVLPLLIGKGTLLSKYLINHDKEYIARIKLGIKTETGDAEGKVIEEKNFSDEILDKENIIKTLNSFKGKSKQTPPMYSSIKVNGKKLYEYARRGKKINVEPRKIEIYNIELISICNEEKEITYKVNCSKGTYIRTLCEDIAEKIGTVGYMKELQRTKVGDFSIDKSLKISEITENMELFKQNVISIEQFFKDKEKIKLPNNKVKLFLNGAKLTFSNRNNDIYRIFNDNNEFLGIGKIENEILKRDICIDIDK